MLSNPKSSADTLFEYVLSAFKVQEMANILINCGATFQGSFLVWTYAVYSGKGDILNPKSFTIRSFAINPYDKAVTKLESENQNPLTGIVQDPEKVAFEILASLVTSVNLYKAIPLIQEAAVSPREKLFNLIKSILEDKTLYDYIDRVTGTRRGNYLIWEYDEETGEYYGINPYERIIVSLNSLSQPVEDGFLVEDEEIIVELLEYIEFFLDDAKNTQFFIFYNFSPNTFRAGATFSVD